MEINKIKYDEKKKSIIVIEGPQGVGKTGFTNYCRENIPFTDKFQLSGTSDKTITGYKKAKDRYYDLLRFMKKYEKYDLNMLFDRTFFSEEAYCRLGYKAYQFHDIYLKLLDKLNDFDLNIFIIFLYLENIELYEERLKRDKTKSFTPFALKSSTEQQEVYLQMAEELEIYNNINAIVVPNDNFTESYKKLHKLLPPLETKMNTFK